MLPGEVAFESPGILRWASAPHLVCDFDNLAELRPLRLLGEDVALLGRRKATLRRERELLQRSESRRFVDAALDVVLLFQRAVFRSDKAENHDLRTGRQESQRLEAAGAIRV